MKTITLPNNKIVPALGQGTWKMGEDAALRQQEIAALKQGIDLGLTLIDTAEMYGNGGAERIVAQAIQGQRDKVFIVSKVLPSNASYNGTIKACERSLRALGCDHIDLYLLHWRGAYPLEETVTAFETLIDTGKIGAWGVSNFDTIDMEELAQYARHSSIATNQILYNLTRRGPEFDLFPWCRQKQIPLMAYSPIEQGRLLSNPVLADIASIHQTTAAAIALNWVLTKPDIIAIPKAATVQHVSENHKALDIVLTAENLAKLDTAFAPPTRKMSLEMI